MKILLHICCAPCAIYTTKKLKERDDTELIEGFFYNPNIHPASEYIKRKESAEKLICTLGIKINFFRDLEFQDFFRKINFHEGQKRCSLCWQLRLDKTAEYAANNSFDAFTTTLLISPYQGQEKIKRIGEEAAGKYSASFLYEDFRPGFRESHKLSKEMGLYHQKYCGCIYSEKERLESPVE